MKLFKYWTENFKKTKDAFDYVMLLVGIISAGIFAVCYIGDFKNPISETLQKIGETGLAAFFVVWCLIWLPFRRHKADKISHEKSVNLLNQEITKLKAELQADVVDLKITAEMSLEHKINIQGLLTVKVLNKGKKEAKIRRVVALIMPDTFSLLSKATKGMTGQFKTNEPGEIILKQRREITFNSLPEIIKIQGDDGLQEWIQELFNNPHFVSYEKGGMKYRKGYVELTSERKIQFEFQILPEDSWRVIHSQKFRAV